MRFEDLNGESGGGWQCHKEGSGDGGRTMKSGGSKLQLGTQAVCVRKSLSSWTEAERASQQLHP